MASEVKLPRLGQGMESGTIVRWLKAEGDPVEKGEPLYELDTDKVTQEVEAEASGLLLKIAVREGEVPVGRTIAVIGEAGEEVPGIAAEPEPAAEPVPQPRQEDGRPAEREERPVASAGGRVKASPLARRIARERGVDLASLRGTGPEGRIVADDVERTEAGAPLAPAAAPAPVVLGEVERRELTSVRRTIARRLTEAWQIPVFQLQSSADMSHVNALVARLRETEEGPKLTVTDVLIKVCAAALMRHREVNAEWTEAAILIHPTANIGIAVAAPQGLVVPVIHGAERLTLAETAAARAAAVTRAREGKLQREDMERGTFTISNLGMYRVERFTAVLNVPQAAILAVGATEERAVPSGGEIVLRPMLTLTATFDHRAVDGAPAAEFLQSVKELLEEPALML
ncbi:MAG TPA: dihydrolipoamide acetyltransferase family protein [Gaiellaceae bacterium]|nr:dihydrolipoamide acetyltransferase family protein [Gaiellaceae bacterium]